MKRLLPYLVFVLITAGLVAFVYKDRIFPPEPGTNTAGASPGGGGRRGGGPGGGGNRRGDQVVPILAEKAKTADVPVYLNGVGTVQAFNTATVRTQVSGRLIDVPYKEGQDVKEGDVLARIDPVLYQAAYDQVVSQKAKDEAVLANARLDATRYTNLVKTNSASQQQADTAVWAVQQNEAQVKIDQALIDNAKANLDYATIKAPLAGRTGIRLVDKGNLVSATDATGIVVITQLKPIAILFTLPENTVASVLEAQSKGPVPLQAVTGGGVLGEGSLLVIDNQIDQTTGTVRIKGNFPNEKNLLWPGQFVNVRLKLKTLENAIVVPSVAVQEGATGSYVYLVTPESTVKLTHVKVVQEGERRSVIGEGVAVGDLVVTSGFASLQDGAKVRVDTAPPGNVPPAGGPSPGAPPAAGNVNAPNQATPTGAGESTGDQQPRKRRRDEAAADGANPSGDESSRRRRRDRPADPANPTPSSTDTGSPKQ